MGTERRPWRATARPPQHLLGEFCAAVLVVLLVIAVPLTAFANEEEEPTQSRLLVLQAVSLIANGASTEAVIERVGDALAAPDAAGTDLPNVRAARELLEGEASSAQLQQARELLTRSIAAPGPSPGPGPAGYGPIPAPGHVNESAQLATGSEPGTGNAVLDELSPSRGISDGGDAVLVGFAVVAIGVGILLAFRWRPAESVRLLRRQSAGMGD